MKQPPELKCTTKGCDNLVEDGGLQCAKCRGRDDHDREIKNKKKRLPKELRKLEKDVRLEIKQWYRTQGALVWDTEQGWRSPFCNVCGARTGNGTSRVDKGLPDLIVLWPGRGVRFIECKSDTGKQTIEQKEFEKACQLSSTIYLLPRCLDHVVQFEGSWVAS